MKGNGSKHRWEQQAMVDAIRRRARNAYQRDLKRIRAREQCIALAKRVFIVTAVLGWVVLMTALMLAMGVFVWW